MHSASRPKQIHNGAGGASGAQRLARYVFAATLVRSADGGTVVAIVLLSHAMTPGPSSSVPYGVIRSTSNIAGGVIRESYFRRSIIVVSRSDSLWCPMDVHVRTDGDDATARLVTEDHRRVQHEEEYVSTG